MSLKKSFIKSRNSFKVTFKVPKQVNPDGKDIRVLGSFNNWSWEDAPSLKPSRGTFKVDVELEAGKEYTYRYLIDQDYWVNDGSADAYEATPFENVENCVVILEQPEITVKKATVKKAAAKKPVAKKTVAKNDFSNDGFEFVILVLGFAGNLFDGPRVSRTKFPRQGKSQQMGCECFCKAAALFDQ